MNVIESDNMAALSLTPNSSSVSRHTASPPSNKGMVTFGNDDVMSSNALSSSFYEGDNDDEYFAPKSELGRKDSAGSHVGFSLDLSEAAASDDGSADVDVNYNSSGSGDGSGHKKFLTAKYKKQRMGMVRRRIEVEDWIDVELRRLFELPEGSYETYDAELDVDELIEFSTDNERKSYVKSQLSNSRISDAKIDLFVQELVGKIAAL